MVMASDGLRKPRLRASAGGGRDLGHGDGLEVLLERFEDFHSLAACVRSNRRPGFDALEGELLAASASGDEADAGLDQTHVELGVRLAASGSEGDFDASSEAHAVGRDDHRAGTELDGLGHVLELLDGHLDLVPLLFLDGEEQLHEVRADGEVGRVAGDDEGGEVGDRLGRRLERLGDEGNDVAAQGVHLGVQLDGGDAVAKIDQRGSGVLLDHAVGLSSPSRGRRRLRLRGRGGTRWRRDRRTWRPEGTVGSSRYHVGSVPCPAAKERSFWTLAAIGEPAARIFSVVARTPAASNISNGPSSQLKPVFIAWSISTMVSAGSLPEFEDTVGGIGEEFGEERPVEGGGLVGGRIGVEELGDAGVRCCSTFFAISSAGSLGRMEGL